MKFRYYFFGGMVSALLLACAGSIPEGGVPSTPRLAIPCTTEISKVNIANPVQLNVGAILCVKLESNLNSGYSWRVSSLDSGLMTQAGVIKLSQTNNGPSGDIATYHYQFEAKAAGQTLLRMLYQPMTTEKAPAVDSIQITINIAP
jgi:predicted secreted protein